MAVGYHKINTSAARSSRRGRPVDDAKKFAVTCKGANIWSPTYGFGVTQVDYVSSVDLVECLFESGYVVTFKGLAVARMIDDYRIQAGK